MTERRLHFNEYGILTAKLTLKTESEEMMCDDFVKSHENAVISYFENEYSTNADSAYRSAAGKRKRFRPYHLTVLYSVRKKRGKYIKTEISSKADNGDMHVITAFHRIFFCFGKEFYAGEKRRKGFDKTR